MSNRDKSRGAHVFDPKVRLAFLIGFPERDGNFKRTVRPPSLSSYRDTSTCALCPCSAGMFGRMRAATHSVAPSTILTIGARPSASMILWYGVPSARPFLSLPAATAVAKSTKIEPANTAHHAQPERAKHHFKA